jgi:hypothetical protein
MASSAELGIPELDQADPGCLGSGHGWHGAIAALTYLNVDEHSLRVAEKRGR